MPADTNTDTTTERRPSVAPPSNAQLYARTRFEYHMARLRIELRKGSPRAHLESLLRLCTDLIDQSGCGAVVDRYRNELGSARAAVAWCSPKRVVTR